LESIFVGQNGRTFSRGGTKKEVTVPHETGAVKQKKPGEDQSDHLQAKYRFG
jgi:hypothetical protein